MKRRFRQKTDVKPRNDPEREEGTSNDASQDNIDIDLVIKEIDKRLKPTRKKK